MTGLSGASTADVLGVAGIVVAAWATVPQLVRIVRGRSVAGVSVAALANAAVSQVAWTTYSLRLHDGWLLGASAVGLPGALGTAWVAWRASRRRADLALPLVWAGTLVLAATGEVLGAWRLLAFVVGGSITWLVLPSAVEVWRSRDVHAVAAGTWWLLVVEAVVAVAYGRVTSTTAPVVFGLVEVTGAAAVLLRLALATRALRRPGPRHRGAGVTPPASPPPMPPGPRRAADLIAHAGVEGQRPADVLGVHVEPGVLDAVGGEPPHRLGEQRLPQPAAAP